MLNVLEFPDLISKNGQTRSALEVSIDFLPEAYKGKWHKVVREFTAKWVRKNAFKKSATLWMWGCISGNLISKHPQNPVPSWSDFIVQFGLPGSFIEELETALARKFGGQVVITEELAFRPDDGWTAICHIEQSKTWAPAGDDTWTPIDPLS